MTAERFSVEVQDTGFLLHREIPSEEPYPNAETTSFFSGAYSTVKELREVVIRILDRFEREYKDT